jgi:hypothetical protein
MTPRIEFPPTVRAAGARDRALRIIAPLAAASCTASLAVLAAAAPAGGGPTFSDPLDIDNEFFPFVEGRVKVLAGADKDTEILVIESQPAAVRTFLLDGQRVDTHTLIETEYEDGELVEISYNYFAQDDDGNVHYFGEVVDNYEDGKVVDHHGSWLVGGPTLPTDPRDTPDAPHPALFMPADPEVGDTWKPEDFFPFVDEDAEVIGDDLAVEVEFGTFEDVLRVRETSVLDPVGPLSGPHPLPARISHMDSRIICGLTALGAAVAGVVALERASAGAAGPQPGRAPTFTHPLDIDHPFTHFPATGSTVAKASLDSDGQFETARVLPATRTFEWNGQLVDCRVVEEEEVEDDVLLETSENYFAEADDGTVYTFGEVVFEHGTSTGQEQSWLVGGPTLPSDPKDTLAVHQPTVFLPARLAPGTSWTPEQLGPEHFEHVTVISFGKTVSTPAGTFSGCVELLHTGPQGADAHVKYFAPGIGEVQELQRDSWKHLVELRVGL